MSKRPVSNPLALAVLSCLWERPMYPYEMTTSLRERGKEDSIRLNFGSLYAVIKSLEKHGLIEATHTEREGNRPERVVYDITEAGKTEAVDWLRELIAQPMKEYPAFETGLSLLPMLPPAEATALLRDRVARLDADLAERERLGHHTRGAPAARAVPHRVPLPHRHAQSRARLRCGHGPTSRQRGLRWHRRLGASARDARRGKARARKSRRRSRATPQPSTVRRPPSQIPRRTKEKRRDRFENVTSPETDGGPDAPTSEPPRTRVVPA